MQSSIWLWQWWTCFHFWCPFICCRHPSFILNHLMLVLLQWLVGIFLHAQFVAHVLALRVNWCGLTYMLVSISISVKILDQDFFMTWSCICIPTLQFTLLRFNTAWILSGSEDFSSLDLVRNTDVLDNTVIYWKYDNVP